MSTKQKKANVRLKHADAFKIGTLLHAHCRKDENGFAVYDDGWSDEVIARAALPDAPLDSTKASVGYLRLQLDLGKLRNFGPPQEAGEALKIARDAMRLAEENARRLDELCRALGHGKAA